MRCVTNVIAAVVAIVACSKSGPDQSTPATTTSTSSTVVNVPKPPPGDPPPEAKTCEQLSAPHAPLAAVAATHQLTAPPDTACPAQAWAPVDMTRDFLPSHLSPLELELKMSGNIRGTSVSFAAEGDRIWIDYVSCGACRRVMGWAAILDLNRMSDDELREAMRRLDIADDVPLLRTAAAWEDALRANFNASE